MATVRGITLTPNEVQALDLSDAGAVQISSDGSAAVYYTLDGSDPTPTSTLVIPAGSRTAGARLAGRTVKLLSNGSPVVSVAAYSPEEAEATTAGQDAHAAMEVEIVAAKAAADNAEATGQNARQMVLTRDPRLAAVEVTAAQAATEHAAIRSELAAAIANVQLTPGPKGDKGDPGQSAYEAAREVDGYGGTKTQWIASLKGAKGDKGDQGIQGVKGDKGDTGLQGLKGDQGIQGVKGDPGTPGTNGTNGVSPVLGIGTVSTLAAGAQATATLGGTQANPTLNLGIPQGAQGAAGSGGGGVAVLELAADRAFSTASYADITDWVIPLPAGDVVTVDGILVFQSAALTTGFGFGARVTAVGGGSVLTPSRFLLTFEYQISATAWATATQTAPTTPMTVTTAAYVANSGILCRITGQVEVGATAGELRFQARSEVAGSAITLRKGSPLRVM